MLRTNNRLVLGDPNNINLLNIDNAAGNLRIFREDFASFPNGGANGAVLMTIQNNGNVAIGRPEAPSGYKLAVAGKIITEGVKVRTQAKGWPDYVFEPTYELPKLETVAAYVKENKHLPEIPSATEVEKEGIDLAEMNAKLLKKVEELTLYLIEQNKRIEQLEKKLEEKK